VSKTSALRLFAAFRKDIYRYAIIDISINKPAGTIDTNHRFSPYGASVIF